MFHAFVNMTRIKACKIAADDMINDAEDYLSDAALSDMLVDSGDDAVTDSASMVDDVIDNLETF